MFVSTLKQTLQRFIHRLIQALQSILSWAAQYPLAFLGLSLMVSASILGIFVSKALVETKREGSQVIEATGSAERFIEADTAQWTLGVLRRANSLAEGYKALEGDVTMVRHYLISHGLPASDMTVNPMTTDTIYQRDAQGNSTGKINTIELRQSLRIESKQLDAVQANAQSISTLLLNGLTLENQSPEYYYSKLNDLKVDMLGLATQNAKARVQSMARYTGNTVGALRSARMGVFQITARQSTEVSDYGVYDTSSRSKKVTAVVNASFSIH